MLPDCVSRLLNVVGHFEQGFDGMDMVQIGLFVWLSLIEAEI